MYSNGNLFPLLSLSEIVSCETGPDEILLYCKTGNVSVRPLPHLSFSTGTDLSNVDGWPLCRLSEEHLSEEHTDLPIDSKSRQLACDVRFAGFESVSRKPKEFGQLAI